MQNIQDALGWLFPCGGHGNCDEECKKHGISPDYSWILSPRKAIVGCCVLSGLGFEVVRVCDHKPVQRTVIDRNNESDNDNEC